MTTTSDTVEFWNILYVDQCIGVRNGLSLGIDSVSDSGTGVQEASVDASSNLNAPNMYTQSRADGLLTYWRKFPIILNLYFIQIHYTLILAELYLIKKNHRF